MASWFVSRILFFALGPVCMWISGLPSIVACRHREDVNRFELHLSPGARNGARNVGTAHEAEAVGAKACQTGSSLLILAVRTSTP